MPRFFPGFVLFLVVEGCSGGLNGEAPEADEAARRYLPKTVGVLISESASSLDSAAIESILPGTHRRVITTGFGVDPDMQLRRLRDPENGKERIFTLHSTQGVVVERDRDGKSVARHEVFEAGKSPSTANPLDVAIADDGALWITRHGEPSLLVVAKDRTRRKVDLAPFGDEDGMPDMSAVTILDGRAYVALRGLRAGFDPAYVSRIVVVDTKTLAVAPFLDLPAKDPGAKFRVRDGALWISCIGGPLSQPPNQEAALVRIDLASKTATAILPPAVVSGFVTAFDFVEDGSAFAVVASFAEENPTSLVRFDPTTGKVGDTVASTTGYDLWDVVAVSGSELVLVADRDPTAPGVRVLSRIDGARLGYLPTRLPPIEVIVLR